MSDRRNIDYGEHGRFGTLRMFAHSNAYTSTLNQPNATIPRYPIYEPYVGKQAKRDPWTNPYPELVELEPSETISKTKDTIQAFWEKKHAPDEPCEDEDFSWLDWATRSW